MTNTPKILCVLRIGNNQTCANWALSPEFLARVTVVLSRFQSFNFHIPEHPSILHHEFKGGKWEGIFNFFRENPHSLHEYDYFFFPDDDIETSAKNILSFFDACSEYGLKLAQPALKPDSYFSHLITIQRSAFKIRYTDYVELMTPYMARSMLIKCLPFFEKSKFGWGLDYIWGQFVETLTKEVGIVDSTPVGHYRPLAMHNKSDEKAQAASKKMLDEYNFILREYEVKSFTFSIFSAISNKNMQRRLSLHFSNFVSIHNLPDNCHAKPKTFLRSLKKSRREIRRNSKLRFNRHKANIFIEKFYNENSYFNVTGFSD